MYSTNVKTSNVLLKVTVPKRTGRKRKRGSSEPFCEYPNATEDAALLADQLPESSLKRNDASSLLRCIKDNPETYNIEAIGEIDRTHRFRGMPDFVLSTANAPFMQKMKQHILPFDYEKMKGFQFDLSRDFEPDAEIIPPPSWSHDQYPFNYSYHQNPAVKKVIDQFGKVGTTNIQGPRKAYNHPVPFDIAEVPSGPAPEVLPPETLGPMVQELIKEAQILLEQRPIYTRRALQNTLRDLWDKVGDNSAKHIYQYVGYIFQSGPWRDAVIRFGVDPRKDPHYRIYQCLMFMLEKVPQDSRAKFQRKNAEKARRSLLDAEEQTRRRSHIFDGSVVSKDGKVWQVCDIHDPIIRGILETEDLRPECDIERDGWYRNGTWARAKTLMKHKIERLLKGEQPDNQLYTKLARGLPDTYEKNDTTSVPKGKYGKEEGQLRAAVRSAAFLYKPAAANEGGNEGRRKTKGNIPEELDEEESRVDEGGDMQPVDDLEVPSDIEM